MRDIIRCGLAMIVCFAALAGLYVIAGAPVVAAAAGAGLHRRDQRARPVRDHAHPDQGGAQPRWCSRPRPFPAAIAAAVLALLIAVVGGVDRLGRDRQAAIATDTDDAGRRPLFGDFMLPFEVVSVLLLAAVIGGVFLAKREHGGTD